MKKTKLQIENKIKDLDFWLKSNPNHFDFAKKNNEKKDLETAIINRDYALRTNN